MALQIPPVLLGDPEASLRAMAAALGVPVPNPVVLSDRRESLRQIAAAVEVDIDPLIGLSFGLAVNAALAEGLDPIPGAFTFTDVTAVALGTVQTSGPFTVSGLTGASPISVTGGTYNKNGGTYTSVTGTVVNDDVVRVRHTSSASELTAVNTVLTIGGVSDTFTSTTADLTPSAFSFVDQTDVVVSTLTNSAWVHLLGTTGAAAISVTGGQYQIADDGSGTNATAATAVTGTIAAGKWFRAVHTSSADPATAVNTVVTIGGVSDTFTSTTAA